MAKNRIFVLVLIITLSAVNAYQYCNPDDCRAEVNSYLSNPQTLCQATNTRPVQEALLKCIRWENGIECPRWVRDQMIPVAADIQDTRDQHCPSREARDSCQLIEMVGCLADFAVVLASPNLFPLDDMEEFCNDLVGLTQALGKCINCVGRFFGNWESVEADVTFATNVSLALVNGGCKCAVNITKQIDTIDNNSTCAFVSDVSGIANTIASHCIVPAINSVQSFNWLTMTDNLLQSVLTVAQSACLFFNGAHASAASSTAIILGGFFVTLIFTYDKFNTLF